MGKWLHVCPLVVVAACGAGDNKIDPGDLELRDLLGISPEAADRWDPTQRAAARRVLAEHLGVVDDARTLRLSGDVVRAIAAIDVARAKDGDGALGVVRVAKTDGDGGKTEMAAIAAPTAARGTAGERAAVAVQIALDGWDAPAWRDLPARGLDVLGAIAADAGHASGTVVVVPAPRLAVIAAYVEPARVLVNPVLLAALEPVDGEVAAPSTISPEIAGESSGAAGRAAPTSSPPAPPAYAAGGNPYSFYGSVAECAFAERTRCEGCLPSNDCRPETNTSDGNAECSMLGANDGRGYFLYCTNLALAITSVAACAASDAPSCARDTHAASSLATLEANANFVDDAACSTALDGCLAKIFGAPPAPFPGVDAGGGTPPEPPRDVNVSCGDSCSNNNCEASPSCGSGPSCGNAFSCDSACSSSNNQSGCGDSSGGGGGGGGCGGDSGGGSSGGGCGGSSSSGSSGGGCGGGDSGGSCGGGDSGGCGGSNGGGGCGGLSGSSDGCGGGSSGGGGCGGSSSSGGGGGCGGDSSSGGGGGCGGSSSSGGGGGCGGSSSSGGSSGCGGGSSGGGGGSSGCTATRRDPPASVALIMALVWGLLPVPFAALARRSSKRRRPRVVEVPPVGVPTSDLSDFDSDGVVTDAICDEEVHS